MTRLAALIVCLIGASTGGSTLAAQRPERQQEVKVPGTNISLRVGWLLLFREGCRFAVPGSWHPNDDASLVIAPDGSNISVRAFRVTSWSAHKAQIKAAFGSVKVVHEDSDLRLWFEIGEKTRIQHYVDVLNGPTVCSALLEIHVPTMPDAADTLNRIVASVGPE